MFRLEGVNGQRASLVREELALTTSNLSETVGNCSRNDYTHVQVVTLLHNILIRENWVI